MHHTSTSDRHVQLGEDNDQPGYPGQTRQIAARWVTAWTISIEPVRNVESALSSDAVGECSTPAIPSTISAELWEGFVREPRKKIASPLEDETRRGDDERAHAWDGSQEGSRNLRARNHVSKPAQV